MPIEAISPVFFAATSTALPQRTAHAQAPPAAQTSQQPGEQSPGQPTVYPNPASRLDPALNMVILEFRDTSGRITESLPTTKQLEQFRLNLPDAAASGTGIAGEPPGDAGTGSNMGGAVSKWG